MAYDVVVPLRVGKQIDALARADWRRVRAVIDGLSQEPRPKGALRLTGQHDTWRIRVGDYRILYAIEDDRLVVLLLKVAHRREVYRTP